MNVKFVIFVPISVLLVAAIYSSFAFVQFAYSIESYCAFYADGRRTCIHTYKDDEGAAVWICSEAGCDRVVREESPLPSKLKNELDAAIQESKSTTKGLNDLTPGSAPLPPLTSDETEVPSKSLGNLKFGDITELKNDTKPSKDLGDLQDEDGSRIIDPNLP
jgi:hypothetical protein